MPRDDLEPGRLDTDAVEVRTLAATDLDWVVEIDRQHSGRSRRKFYEVKLGESEKDTGIRISLAAVVDGEPAGFLMGRLYYGEFGLPEPAAVLDAIGVAKVFAGRKVGKALMRQLCMNLEGLGIDVIQTQIDWADTELMSFFRHAGFRPAPRWCLEMPVEQPLR